MHVGNFIGVSQLAELKGEVSAPAGLISGEFLILWDLCLVLESQPGLPRLLEDVLGSNPLSDPSSESRVSKTPLLSKPLAGGDEEIPHFYRITERYGIFPRKN